MAEAVDVDLNRKYVNITQNLDKYLIFLPV